MALFIAIITFVVAGAICFLLWFSFSSISGQEVIQRRMQAVQRAEQRGSADLGVQLLRDELMSGVPTLNRALMKWSWSRRFKDFVSQAGMQTRPGVIILSAGSLALVGFLVMQHFYAQFPGPLVAALLAGASPFAYVAFRRQKRLRRFEESFPEALDLLNRAVRAGHAFTTGLGMIASESPEPVSGEFRTTFEEQNFGLPLRDALQNLAERVPIIDVRFFVTALLIQKETGGNLSEILENLAHVIRDRFRIYREVRARSAHGRLTAGILVAMPPLMVLGFSIVNPHYMTVLFHDRIGPTLLWGAGIWQAIGAVLLWKIVHIEV